MATNGSSKRQKMEGINKVTVVLGAQFGDEGKGKIVDMLCQDADVVCRCQVFDHETILMISLIIAHIAGLRDK